MELKEVLDFIENEHKRLLQYYKFKENREMKYPIVVKIMEELGELCEEILADDKIQRADKERKSKIEDEVADVIFSTLVLAENLKIDVVKALEDKINIIKKRKY